MNATYPQRLAAEALGTAFLVATVVGSGIMVEVENTPDEEAVS